MKKCSKMKKLDLALNLGKICIIGLVGVFLIGNITPFYEGKDTHHYGIISVNFANGIFSYSNDLLQEFENIELLGGNWVKTTHNTVVPMSGNGLGVIGAIFFVVGGYSGLFLVTPIFAIILLIVSERVSTILFGKWTGLLTLLLISSSNLLFRNSTSLQTEAVFGVFFILGVYFLIRTLKTNSYYYPLLASLFFVLASQIRIAGVLAFPVEIIIFSIIIIQKNKSIQSISTEFSDKKIKIRKNITINWNSEIKRILLLTAPWIIFFIGFMMYHQYYFDDPFTNYTQEIDFDQYETDLESILEFSDKDAKIMTSYSKYLLPYQIVGFQNRIDSNLDDFFGYEWIGIVALLLVFLTLLISIVLRMKILEITVFIFLIIINVWFYSTITTEERAANGVAGRYIISSFILSSMIFSFMIISSINNKIFTNKSFFLKKIYKIFIICTLVFFFSSAFYFWPTIDGIIHSEINFKNIEKFASRYPLDLEGLKPNDVVIAMNPDRIREYGVIPFTLGSPESITEDTIILLKQIIQKDYDVYVPKESTSRHEKDSLRFLINEHGFIIKDHSKSFCKILIGEEGKFQKTDNICLEN